MSTSLRIEELKKKFDENPRRYFAPLANEYRKAGDLQQAISICQAHLPQQPGHMSGHIVYGQALFEARQFDQARTVFETALALDPENLIALRYLGDIAFELGDRAGARSWYTRVLETDPRNEEIAALMAAMGEERGVTQREAAQPSVAAAPAAEPPAPQKTAAESPAAAGTREAAAPASPADAELEKLFARPQKPQETAQAVAGPPSAPAPAAPSSFSPLSGFEATRLSDAAPSLEERAPSLGSATPAAAGAGAGTPPDSALRRPTFDAQRGDDAPLQRPPEGAAATPMAPPAVGSTSRGTGFVTETMAELYLKQGFHDRALEVYRQLVAQSPEDRALRERMERVEHEARSAMAWSVSLGSTSGAPQGGARDGAGAARGRPTVRQFLSAFGTRGVTDRGRGVAAPPAGVPRTSGELRAPTERPARAAAPGSIDALFAGATPSREDATAASTLADAFQSGAAGAPSSDTPIGGRPAHPAATELSLDHVFRDGGNVASGRTSSAVSYDQFFSPPAQEDASGADEPSGAAPAAGSDDIEQFNAWLQGLKKR